MLTDLLDGFLAYFKVLPLIRKYRLGLYLLITGLISLIIGSVVIFIAYQYSDNIGMWFSSFYKWEIGKEVFDKMATGLAGIFIVAVALILYKYLVIIAVAPFMSLLSEKLEYKISYSSTGTNISLKRAIQEMIRGIRISIRNIIRELFFTMLLLLASFIPFVAVFTGPAIFVLQSYYAGFGNMDFYLERHMNIRDSANFVSRYTGLAISNGAVYLVMLMIPVLGLFFAPTLGTAAATIESIKRRNFESNF